MTTLGQFRERGRLVSTEWFTIHIWRQSRKRWWIIVGHPGDVHIVGEVYPSDSAAGRAVYYSSIADPWKRKDWTNRP